ALGRSVAAASLAELLARVGQLGLGHLAVLVGVERGEILLRDRVPFLRRDRAALVGVDAVEMPGLALAGPVARLRSAGRHELVARDRAVAVGVDLGEAVGVRGGHLLAGDRAVLVGVDALEEAGTALGSAVRAGGPVCGLGGR